MVPLDTIYNEDCLDGMKRIPSGTVDLVIADPPYDFKSTKGGGAFGTTAVAALMEGRHYIGFEINEDYYNTALKRIGQFKR